jgi:hypothetical protein
MMLVITRLFLGNQSGVLLLLGGSYLKEWLSDTDAEECTVSLASESVRSSLIYF